MAVMNALLKLDPFTVLLIIILVVSPNSIAIINSKSTPHLATKTTNIEFYFHDQMSGKTPTAVPIVKPNISSTTFFGNLVMTDDLLTVGPDPKSTPVGRAQGMYGGADLKKVAVLMVMNFVFTEKSEYNGSTLAVLGRNEITSAVREMSIVGGTRDFRYAQGFAQANTVRVDDKGDAIVHYNVTVLQYMYTKGDA